MIEGVLNGMWNVGSQLIFRYLLVVCSSPLADIGPLVLESPMNSKQTPCRLRGSALMPRCK